MNDSVYIRPLEVKDGLTSYAWRNNPKIWRLTGSRPDRYITPEIEMDWIQDVINRPDEIRYAICCSEDDAYIGNIFLTNIKDKVGYIHLFLGDVNYWGGGRAFTATQLFLKTAFSTLGLDTIYAEINRKNVASLSLAKGCHFKHVDEYRNEAIQLDLVKLVYTKEMYENSLTQSHYRVA